MKRFSDILIDIDTQVDFMLPDGALYVTGADKIIPNLGRLFEWAKRNNIPIISSVDAHTADDPEFKDFPPHCVKGTDGQKKIEETLIENHKIASPEEKIDVSIFDKHQQIIFEKQTFSLFNNSQAKELIELLEADRFIVCGVATDYCVRAAVEGLIQSSKNVCVVSDAIAAVNASAGQAAMEGFLRHGVEISRTEHIIATKSG